MGNSQVFLNVLKGIIGRDKASTAIEFSLLAVPFIIMFVGIVEVGLYFGTAVILEGAATDAARMIRTGQVQKAGNSVELFEDALCNVASVMVNCGDIQYEVIVVPDGLFSSVASYTPTFDSEGNLVSSGFDPGSSEDLVIVRVVYRYEFMTPLLGDIMENAEGTNHAVLMSNVIIMNEPYEFGDTI